MHFFNPPSKMPLVEVVSGRQTDGVSVAAAVKLARSLGKVPVVISDCPGFLVNRLLMPYLNEASYLAGEGVPVQRIDSVMEDFGWPMGPFKLMDMIGIDVGYKVARVLFDSYGGRMKLSRLFSRVGETEELLGKKSGKGFYTYDGKNISLNPGIEKIIADLTGAGGKGAKKMEDHAVRMRLMLPMLYEAARAMQEGIAASEDDVDMAMVLGAGFPPFRGGLFRWARLEGIDDITEYGEKFRIDSNGDGGAVSRFKQPEALPELVG
jgi:3-hydroxyacyl-CoA dehydrogenase/enoyl-CoA hydratase/3-hydroxybutyryl-CoA epimerase